MNKRRLNDVTPEEWDAMYSLQLQMQPVVFTKPVKGSANSLKDVRVLNTDVDYNHLVEWNPAKKTLH
jgi:hypothetical protein